MGDVLRHQRRHNARGHELVRHQHEGVRPGLHRAHRIERVQTVDVVARSGEPRGHGIAMGVRHVLKSVERQQQAVRGL